MHQREKTLIAIAGTGPVAKMPERPLTIAAYAAGASLAAVTLVYCFGPTFFLDNDAARSSKTTRRNGVVGLVNPANDCFINSVLQALAGVPELRTYLIREVHRRELDGPEIYADISGIGEKEQGIQKSRKIPDWQMVGLQQGVVTAGLKDVLNALNERPIYRKTISAQGFIHVVEQAFRTRISRSQQDAQEFLQVIVERVAEEYRAGSKARHRAKQSMKHSAIAITAGTASEDQESGTQSGEAVPGGQDVVVRKIASSSKHDDLASEQQHPSLEACRENDEVFPMEGALESQVECLHCQFKPKPSKSTFLTLTLNVPHAKSSTTLNECLDGMFKIEHIDDFTCDRCRLNHALQTNESRLLRSSLTSAERSKIQSDNQKILTALNKDPEEMPKDVVLPDLSTVPKRRISRHTRMATFPRILAIHLSRSIWDPNSVSFKNLAKVAFPENLSLGGLVDRKNYRLLCVVMHKGGHNSGHYESFRRQALSVPFSTPASMGTGGVYSVRSSPAQSPRPSAAPSPHLKSTAIKDQLSPSLPTHVVEMANMTPDPLVNSESGSSSESVPAEERKSSRADASVDSLASPSIRLSIDSAAPTERLSSKSGPNHRHSLAALRSSSTRRKNNHDRWWRISDDKIKESKTSEVLNMQKEVYLLFYELVTES